MKATLDIDEDVLAAARELAARRGLSAGKILSELARRALATPSGAESGSETESETGGATGCEARVKHGIHLLPRREGAVVTSELVYRLMDEE